MMYKAQIICISIVLFIGIFYFSSIQKKARSAKWFSTLLVFSILQLIFDAGSLYTVNHLETVSPITNRVVHNIFLSLLLVLFYLIYKYFEALIEEERKAPIQRNPYSAVPLVVTIIAICLLRLDYIETPITNYSFGPAVYALYGSIGIYIVLIMNLLRKYRKELPGKWLKIMIIATLMELALSVFQACVPTALISCLGIVLLVLSVYLTVENPDAILVKMLEKETKRADIANQAKTNFLANMSHEIRTPINAVLGMNEMILRESREKNIREYARDVQGAAKSLLSIINDILDITKIEAGKLTIIPVEYAFSSIIHDVTNMISFKAKAKELEFKVNIDENIPSQLRGDDIRVRQILVNLLNNAVKYTHEGTVTLEVKLLSCQQKTASIAFSVKDTGIGIKEEDIQKLYVPFERIEEKRNRNIEGTELGMNITMQLLELLHSELKVASEYGKGSEFSFVLKQEIINEEPIGNLGEQIQTDADSGDEEYRIAYEAPEAKILVVDDNEMNRKVFCGLLKDTKIQIEQAASGKECIEKVRNTTFDIIFMDHMMPEMDGVETFQMMKTMGDYPCKDTPVVILTANAIAGAKESYLAEGFQDFLSKPVDAQKLENMIEEMLDKNLICYVKREKGKREDSLSYDVSHLPIIDGLDWAYAAAHFKDEEAMISTVKFFLSALEYEAQELEGFFENIHTTEGRKNYRIKVHSMKNAANIIGIIPLAGMAKVLENAARDEICDTLVQMTPIFLNCWREYGEHLAMFSDVPKETKNATECKEEVEQIFCEIRAAAEDMDMDALDALLQELERYQFEGEAQETFEQIKKAIINFDVKYLQEM